MKTNWKDHPQHTLHGYPVTFMSSVYWTYFNEIPNNVLRELESLYPIDLFTGHIREHVQSHNRCKGEWSFSVGPKVYDKDPIPWLPRSIDISILLFGQDYTCYRNCGYFKIDGKVVDYAFLCNAIKDLYIFSNAGIPLYILLEILEEEFKTFKSFEIYLLLKELNR